MLKYAELLCQVCGTDWLHLVMCVFSPCFSKNGSSKVSSNEDVGILELFLNVDEIEDHQAARTVPHQKAPGTDVVSVLGRPLTNNLNDKPCSPVNTAM